MTKHTRTKKPDRLVGVLNQFASDLMAKCKDMPIEQRVDIFREVAKWVQIRNRLDEAGEMGEGLHGYRDKLAGPAPEAKPDPHRGKGFDRQAAGRSGMAVRWGGSTDTADDYGGSALDAIKSRIPRPDAGGDERDRDDPGGEGDDVGRSDWGLRPGVGSGS